MQDFKNLTKGRHSVEKPNSVIKAAEELSDKMYIANVRNRLRQLNSPTVNDCRRWFWELMQNAKDSIAGIKGWNKKIEITAKVVEETLTNGQTLKTFVFSHNGAPFTGKSQYALLYKYSEGKANQSESTGRFGTGFLTTHTLSKEVNIVSNVYDDDDVKNTYKGFTVELHREGKSDGDLLAGVKKMRESLCFSNEPNKLTSYYYPLKNENNIKALEMGLSNFEDNIVQTLLFCPEVGKVTISDTKNETIYKPLRIFKDKSYKSADVEIHEFETIRNGESTIRHFLVINNVNNHSEELTQRFQNERTLRTQIAVEYVEENNTKKLVETKGPSLYCVFPLVGSEQLQLPFLLNSPDFEPDSEREALYLSGSEFDEDKIITDVGTNKLILKQVFIKANTSFENDYERLVDYLISNKYKELHLVARGLSKNPSIEKHFDSRWYQTEILEKMRKTVMNKTLVETDNGLQPMYKGKNINIRIPTMDDENENFKKFYELLKLYGYKMPLFDKLKSWNSIMWESSKVNVNVEKLVKEINSFEKMSNEKFNMTPKAKVVFMNAFIKFLVKFNKDLSFFSVYKLLPTMDGNFVSFKREEGKKTLMNCNKVSDELIDCIEDLKCDLKKHALYKGISFANIEEETNKTMSIFINETVIKGKEIIEKQNRVPAQTVNSKKSKAAFQDKTQQSQNDKDKAFINLIIPLIRRVTKSNDQKFDGFRDFVYNVACKFFPSEMKRAEKKICNDIDENAWNDVDGMFLDIVMRRIEGSEKLDVVLDNYKMTMNMYNVLLKNSQIIIGDKFNSLKVLPNQKGELKAASELYKDLNVPEEFKGVDYANCGVDAKGYLLHNECTLDLNKTKSIEDVAEEIDQQIKKNNSRFIDNLVDKIVLLRPTQEVDNMEFITTLNKIASKLNNNAFIRSINLEKGDLWNNAGQIYIANLCNKVSNGFTLNQFDAKFGPLQKAADKMEILKDILQFSYKKRDVQTLNKLGESMSLSMLHIVDEEALTFVGVFNNLCKCTVNNTNTYPLNKNIIHDELMFPELLAVLKTYKKKEVCGKIDSFVDEAISKHSEACKIDNNFKKILRLLFTMPEIKDPNLFPLINPKKNKIEFDIIMEDNIKQMIYKAYNLFGDQMDENTLMEKIENVQVLKEENDILQAKLENAEADKDSLIHNPETNSLKKQMDDMKQQMLNFSRQMEQMQNMLKQKDDKISELEIQLEKTRMQEVVRPSPTRFDY
ncbi:hypothetical protein EIN_371420 [Entamoeba invadens IP1]|uniref:Uncharacterized protein n=1 Tax=Entamoeba invadens IP1 TaxID=370355 RepID=A0A0A1UBY9_ENTIV|nr:hypothetical protein EIN_371420 [Entamoeba invadens IP1]ELP92730.1 hypothetical protein EIN_371420 [Entamoeba invadens IP1]|eukprot:XP_004259501.1 hypothetical protein EIN_371420 [Entamoeba invadens IP1]